MLHSHTRGAHLLDLPDEMLVIILNKLDRLDVLYSLIGVNKRLDRMACDLVYTEILDFASESSNRHIYLTNSSIVYRFSLQILPRIHHQITWLILEPMFMERILLADTYPSLVGLSIQLGQEEASQYLTDESPCAHLFKEQISHLIVKVIQLSYESMEVLSRDIYARVFAFCKHLTDVEFRRYDDASMIFPSLVLYHLPSTTCSSTLIHLNVSVSVFDDCLRLLDGRLPQLRTFITVIELIETARFPTGYQADMDLSNLTSFSLTCYRRTIVYDERVVPLLQRMSHLEKLTLSLDIGECSTFIDGTRLDNEIFMHMRSLHTFICDIRSYTNIEQHGIHRKSNDDVQRTFVNKERQVSCYVEYLPDGRGRCHIYSLPVTLERLDHITNCFPFVGVFSRVRFLSVFDAYPFEHNFFARIAREFGSLQKLTVINLNPQKCKRERHSNNNNGSNSIITFPRLTYLDVYHSHIDYSEQFLLDINTCLPRLNELSIKYEPLRTITNDFTNDETRVNCAKVTRLLIDEITMQPTNIHHYFALCRYTVVRRVLVN